MPDDLGILTMAGRIENGARSMMVYVIVERERPAFQRELPVLVFSDVGRAREFFEEVADRLDPDGELYNTTWKEQIDSWNPLNSLPLLLRDRMDRPVLQMSREIVLE